MNAYSTPATTRISSAIASVVMAALVLGGTLSLAVEGDATQTATTPVAQGSPRDHVVLALNEAR